MTVVVECTSRLSAPAKVVWAHASSMAGVNAGLAPISMTHPPSLSHLPDDLTDGDPRLGQTLFTSILKLGPLPFDRHALALVDVVPGRSFQEDSSSWINRRWRHRREIRPLPDGGCELTDLLEVTPRLPGSGPLTRWLVTRIFDRRHRYLRDRFG